MRKLGLPLPKLKDIGLAEEGKSRKVREGSASLDASAGMLAAH